MEQSTVPNQDVRTRLRIILPTGIGVLSGFLTIWDIHNWNVIASMGMAWDTGAPIWPYQTSDILLRLLNYPAFLFAMPFANLFNLLAPRHHLFVFPAGLVWWWFIGLWLDRLSTNQLRQRRWGIFTVLVICSALLLSAAIAESASVFNWYMKYGGSLSNLNVLGMLRFLTPIIWFTAATIVAAFAARRSLTGGPASESS